MKFIIQPNKLFKTMNFDSIQIDIKVRTVEVLLYETNGEEYQFVLNQSPVGDLFADNHVQKIMYKKQKYVMDEKCPNQYLLATENACLMIRKILLHENTKIKEFTVRFLKPAEIAKNNTLDTHIRDYHEGVTPFFKFMVDNVFMYDRGPGKPSKENFRLNVEHLILQHDGKQHNLMLWMPFLKEKNLKVVEIYNMMNEIESEFTTVCTTPQWLAAKEVYGITHAPINLPLEDYWNFKKFHFNFSPLTSKDLARLVLHFTCHGNLVEGRMTMRNHESVFKGLWKSEDEKAQKEGETLPDILTYKWNCQDGHVLRATVGTDLVVFAKSNNNDGDIATERRGNQAKPKLPISLIFSIFNSLNVRRLLFWLLLNSFFGAALGANYDISKDDYDDMQKLEDENKTFAALQSYITLGLVLGYFIGGIFVVYGFVSLIVCRAPRHRDIRPFTASLATISSPLLFNMLILQSSLKSTASDKNSLGTIALMMTVGFILSFITDICRRKVNLTFSDNVYCCIFRVLQCTPELQEVATCLSFSSSLPVAYLTFCEAKDLVYWQQTSVLAIVGSFVIIFAQGCHHIYTQAPEVDQHNE